MSNFLEIKELATADIVRDSTAFADTMLHKWLTLGQTRYVCRYGTLSDGHEKLTDAQKYASAIKEMYFLAQNMESMHSDAMEYNADLLEAEEMLHKSDINTPAYFRALAKKLRAERRIKTNLITIKDQFRMLDEYNKIRLELKPKVEDKYASIEDAEFDNWKAVAEYRMLKQDGTGQLERLDNIPMSEIEKAKLGYDYKRADAMAPLIISNQQEFNLLENTDPEKLIKFIDNMQNSAKLLEKQE